jgi:hypothetical protein
MLSIVRGAEVCRERGGSNRRTRHKPQHSGWHGGAVHGANRAQGSSGLALAPRGFAVSRFRAARPALSAEQRRTHDGHDLPERARPVALRILLVGRQLG